MLEYRSRQIPFYENLESIDAPYGEHCLEMCLKMMLEYFDPEKKYTLSELESITDLRSPSQVTT